jgi:hypothetical protein
MIEFLICSIYLIGAVSTGLIIYTLLAKRYSKENSSVKFKYWIDNYFDNILFSSVFWFVIIPYVIITYPIRLIAERIRKHYNIR